MCRNFVAGSTKSLEMHRFWISRLKSKIGVGILIHIVDEAGGALLAPTMKLDIWLEFGDDRLLGTTHHGVDFIKKLSRTVEWSIL